MSEYKRFTKKDKYGHWYTDTKINDRFMWSKDGKVWERNLSHYAFDGEAIDRLAEFEDKLESGLLLELPCKIGDTVYRIIGVNESMVIDTAECNGFEITQKGITPTSEITEFPIYLVGTFLTQEAAEARLKELQEEKK